MITGAIVFACISVVLAIAGIVLGLLALKPPRSTNSRRRSFSVPSIKRRPRSVRYFYRLGPGTYVAVDAALPQDFRTLLEGVPRRYRKRLYLARTEDGRPVWASSPESLAMFFPHP